MTAAAPAVAAAHFERSDFARDPARRVALRSESQDPAGAPALHAYLADGPVPTPTAPGFACQVHGRGTADD